MSPTDRAILAEAICTLRECHAAAQIHLRALLALPTDDEQAPIIGDVIEGLSISLAKMDLALLHVDRGV